jgi:hypothetical protein
VPGCSPSSVTTPTEYTDAKSRKTTRHQPDHPCLRQKNDRDARYVHNDRLIDAVMTQAFSAMVSPVAAGHQPPPCHSGGDVLHQYSAATEWMWTLGMQNAVS